MWHRLRAKGDRRSGDRRHDNRENQIRSANRADSQKPSAQRGNLADRREQGEQNGRLHQHAKTPGSRQEGDPLSVEEPARLIGELAGIGLEPLSERVQSRLDLSDVLLMGRRESSEMKGQREQREPSENGHRDDARAEISVADLRVEED